MSRPAAGLGAVLAAGAALRLATLDVQSLWLDEAVTARLLGMELGALPGAIADGESTPPAYYVLAWLWTRAAGTGEVGLRSLSALLGVATIAAVWALGRRAGGERAALAGAALAALNPLLWWFSQEARAYALLALLAALGALAWLRALERPAPGRLLAWGATAALALATHYFAAFVVAPQALWLALRARPGGREPAGSRAAPPGPAGSRAAPPERAGSRAAPAEPEAPPWALAAALALPLATAAALAPLALDQRARAGAAFIGESALGTRLAQLPKQFLVGYDAPAEALLAVLAAVALAPAALGLARALRDRERRDARALAGLAGAALALPAAAAVAGEDHLITRNMLAALPLLAALAGAGLATLGARAAVAAAASACALGLVAIAGVVADPALQREDWRGVARVLGAGRAPRVASLTPASGIVAVRHYLPAARPPAAVAERSAALDVALLLDGSGDVGAPPAARRAFAALAARVPGARVVRGETFAVLRLPAPPPVAPGELPALLGGDAALLLLPAR